MIQKSIIDLIEKPVSGEWGDEPSHEYRIKILRNTNFTNDGVLNLDQIVERSINQKKIDKKKLKCGDILIEKSGGSPNQPVGRVVYFDQKDDQYLFSNFTSMIRAKEVFPKYLFYLLFASHSFGKTLKYQNKTTGIINLQLERYLKDSTIPLPNYVDQQRIATILDHADAIRRKNREILEKYNQLAQGVFLEMFGDPYSNPYNFKKADFEEVSYKITDGEHQTPKRSTSGFKLLSARNIKKGKIDLLAGVDFVGEEEFNRIYKRCKPERNDILISCSGTIGRVTVNRLDEPFVLVRSVALVKPNLDLINPYYLENYLNSPYMQCIMQKCANASSQANLFTGQIKKLPILVPPIELQNRYTQIILNLESQKNLLLEAFDHSEKLFQSLLQRAFRGEL